MGAAKVAKVPNVARVPKIAKVAKVTKVDRSPYRKLLWVLSAFVGVEVLVAIILTLLLVLPNQPDVVAGLSTRELVLIEAILFLSGLMSGLSGFGFSAVGAATLLFIPPVTEVPLLQTLSTGNQLLSLERLRADMPRAWRTFWAGPGWPIVGGMPGAYAGIWMLGHLPAELLKAVFGSILVLYCVYSLFRSAGARLRGFDGPVTGVIVGFIGGAFGGFTAFPGAALVVWTGLRDLPKAQSRAIVQPYIIMSQLFALGLIALQQPQWLTGRYFALLVCTLPVVLPGTFCGVTLYRRISDVNFRRISFILLGASGAALLIKLYGAALVRLI
ncbi:MAG TPA: sulfite exporter TauE/SafE family protein [Kofleriaceae bacterium]